MNKRRLSFFSRQQVIASAVWKLMTAMRDSGARTQYQAEYARNAHELGALLRRSGLAQTLSYLEVAGGEHSANAERDASGEVGGHNKGSNRSSGGVRPDGSNEVKVQLRLAQDFCAVIGLANSRAVAALSVCDYAIQSRRALEAADYFKRFAVSVLGVERGPATSDAAAAAGEEAVS